MSIYAHLWSAAVKISIMKYTEDRFHCNKQHFQMGMQKTLVDCLNGYDYVEPLVKRFK